MSRPTQRLPAGEVDALVMGEEVYTLKGAETPYRLLIESMNEGAATLAADGTILYCNRRQHPIPHEL
ncbi:MAG: PAS domain-containing protein [Limisphaerales bacterium]